MSTELGDDQVFPGSGGFGLFLSVASRASSANLKLDLVIKLDLMVQNWARD